MVRLKIKKKLPLLLSLVLCLSLFPVSAFALTPDPGTATIGGETVRVTGPVTGNVSVVVEAVYDSTVFDAITMAQVECTFPYAGPALVSATTTAPSTVFAYLNRFLVDNAASMTGKDPVQPVTLSISGITQTTQMTLSRYAAPESVLDKGASMDRNANPGEVVYYPIDIIVQYPLTVNITGAVSGCGVSVDTTEYNTGENTYDVAGSATSVSDGDVIMVDTGSGQQELAVLNFTIPAGYTVEVDGAPLAPGVTSYTMPSALTAADSVDVKFLPPSINLTVDDTLDPDGYDSESSGMLILRGQWASESTHTLSVKVNGVAATAGDLTWSVEGASDYEFTDNCVSVDPSTGEITVLKSGIVRVKATSTANPNESFYVVVIVPGDYNRDGFVSGADKNQISRIALGGISIDSRDYSTELADVNKDSYISGADGNIIARIALGMYEI